MTEYNTNRHDYNLVVKKKNKLVRGIRSKVAAKFNVSENYVTEVKNGRRNNLDILAEIERELSAHRRKTAQLLKKINR